MADFFVTGAAGWLGKALISRLIDGFPESKVVDDRLEIDTIHALVMSGEEKELEPWAEQIEIILGDVRISEHMDDFMRGADRGVLIHLAGVIHPRFFTSDFTHVNVEGTENVITAAVMNNVRRSVVISSNSPLGCNPSREHLFDELSPYNPYMGYGKSKMLLEKYVKATQDMTSMETVLIRSPWFYGPYQPARQTTFFKMIRDGKAPILGDGENIRSMVFIDNLVQGILLAVVTPDANGEIYWIADERSYTMNEVINTVEYLLENEFNIRCDYGRLRLPSLVADIAYYCDRIIQSVGLYQQKVHVLSEMNKNIACSIEKAQRELGYEPLVALEEGMRQSIQYLINMGQLK